MKPTLDPSSRRLVVAGIVLALASPATWAEKPEGAGGGKGKGKNGDPGGKDKHGQDGKDQHGQGKGASHDDPKGGSASSFRFSSDDRRAVTEYYGVQAGKGKCPPGLAKKGTGCLPPGQAKKWVRGQPLPAGVRYYDLPRELRVRLPPPPPNYRYVQVAGDVLLIAVGTLMVVDAIEDILR